MIAVDPREVAIESVRAAVGARMETAVQIDVVGWTSEEVQSMFDALLVEVGGHQLRLCGVRTDNHAFVKLGIPQDSQNSGTYKGTRIVLIPSVSFDTLEFLLQPLMQ